MDVFRIRRVIAASVLGFSVILAGCGSSETPAAREETAVETPTSTELSGEEPDALASTTDEDEADNTTPDSGDSDESGKSVGEEGLGVVSEAEAEPDVTVVEDPPAEDRPEIEIVLDDLIAFVEDERGYDFVSRPAVTLLDTPAFTAAFADVVARDAEEYATDFANFTDIYQAVGIIDANQNLEEIWSLFGDAGVLGYYDTTTKEIVLRSGEITPFTRIVLVHELVHALDDQIFDLDRPEYDDRDDEVSWAFSAIVEGNANVIEGRYRASLSSSEREDAFNEERNLPRSVSLSIFTNSFLELQFSRYEHGELLMSDLWDDGQGAVDDAITNPPTSSEAVIAADFFSTGAVEDSQLPLPPADGSVFESGTWGQVGWAALFADVSPEFVADAAGWGGDSFVAWRVGDQACVRAHVAADTPGDLDRYAEILEAWATLGDREIFYPTAELIRVTSCG